MKEKEREKKASVDVNHKYAFLTGDTPPASTKDSPNTTGDAGAAAAADSSTASTSPRKVTSITGAPQVRKKIMNIPIGDVRIDADYEKNVCAFYSLPVSYLKYHRRIEAHDSDPSTEYVADKKDETWVNNLPSLGTVPRDLARTLTVEVLATVFNLLERYTAQSKEPIPLINAQHLVLEKLRGWTDAACAKLLPEVYEYWKRKREQLQKPLCRKYWPQVNSSDTNPHNVFRARDKEKYRLRKQHKRNDIESFRKMQQLRREFAQAQTLMQLIFERESLREAEFQVQREAFDAQIMALCGTGAAPQEPCHASGDAAPSADVANSAEGSTAAAAAAETEVKPSHGAADDVAMATGAEAVPPPPIALPLRRAASFRYSLKFENILYPPQPTLDAGGSGGAAAGNLGNIAALNTAAAGKKKKKKKDFIIPGATAAAAALPADKAGADASKDIKAGVNGKLLGVEGGSGGQAVAVGEKRKHRKKDKNKLQLYGVDSNGNTVLVADGAAVDGATASAADAGPGSASAATASSSAAADGVAVAEAELDPRRVHPDLDGPKYLCQPSWPSFMANTPMIERRAVVRSVSDYISDLEFRYVPTKSRFSNVPQFCHDGYQWHPTSASIAAAAGIPYDHPFGPYRTEEDLLPSKFRARCRVGRGGRLVVDRIPIYNAPPDDHPSFGSNGSNAAERAGNLMRVEATNRVELRSEITYLQPTSLSHQYPAAAYRQHFGDGTSGSAGAGSGRNNKQRPQPRASVRGVGKQASKDGTAAASFALFNGSATFSGGGGGDLSLFDNASDVGMEANETQSMLSSAAGGSDFNYAAAGSAGAPGLSQHVVGELEADECLLPLSNYHLEDAACRFRLRKKAGAAGGAASSGSAAVSRKSVGSAGGGSGGSGGAGGNSTSTSTVLADVNTSNFYAYSTRFPSMPKIPPLVPAARPCYDAKQMATLREILRKDDGEEICVVMPKRNFEEELDRQRITSMLSAINRQHSGSGSGNADSKDQSGSSNAPIAAAGGSSFPPEADQPTVKFELRL